MLELFLHHTHRGTLPQPLYLRDRKLLVKGPWCAQVESFASLALLAFL